MAFWLISPVLPAKPSAAGSPGRGGARERAQFSPSGGNGDKRTLRRRAAMGKVTRRPQAAKLPAKWRAGSSRPTPGKRLFLHRPLIRPAPSSAPFGGTFPYPFCRCATSPLDKGSRPPGGRLFRRIFVSIRITNVSDEGLTCEVEDCLEFTLNFVQTQGANLTKMSGYFLVKCTFLSVFCVVQ